MPKKSQRRAKDAGGTQKREDRDLMRELLR